MESKNISMQWVQVNEDLQKGYRELEEGRFNFAIIVFDKVLGINDNCGDAYLGKALAEIEQKTLLCALENNLIGELYRKLFYTTDKIRNAILSNDDLSNKLFEYGYNSAEYHSADDAKLILEFLENRNFKEATNRIYMRESFDMLESKAKNYRESYRAKLACDVPADTVFPTIPGAKRLIQNESALAASCPGIIGDLKRTDYYYQEAQITQTQTQKSGGKPISVWMTVEAWIISVLLMLFFWPGAIIYLIYRYNKYGGKTKTKVTRTAVDKERMEFLENKFKNTIEQYNKLCEELRFTLETMLGEEIETFESDASSLGFMRGRSKEILDKYSKI